MARNKKIGYKNHNLQKYIIGVGSFIGVAALAMVVVTSMNQSTDSRVSADASCQTPALKQVIWRNDNGKQAEYYRWVPIESGRVRWANAWGWNQNNTASITEEVVGVAHPPYETFGSFFNKYMITRVNDIQKGRYYKAPIVNNSIDWSQSKMYEWNTPNTGAIATLKGMVALSYSRYEGKRVIKYIYKKDGKFYAQTALFDGNSNGLISRENIELSHWPGTGDITAFNETIYDNKLMQKLVRNNEVYTNSLSLKPDGKIDWDSSKWTRTASVADTAWPGKGVVSALSEYVDCVKSRPLNELYPATVTILPTTNNTNSVNLDPASQE